MDSDHRWMEVDHPWGCLVALDYRDAAHHLAGLRAHQDGEGSFLNEQTSCYECFVTDTNS